MFDKTKQNFSPIALQSYKCIYLFPVVLQLLLNVFVKIKSATYFTLN